MKQHEFEKITGSKFDLIDFSKVAQKCIWGPVELRRYLESNGVHLQPANFYSQFPTLEDIETSFENTDNIMFCDPSVFDHEFLQKQLEEMIPYAKDFSPAKDEDPQQPHKFFLNNSQFSHSDAMAYYSLIKKKKPRRIVEIGSGFSTMIAREAVSENGFGEIVCIEPFPRPFLKDVCHKLIQSRIQDVPIENIVNLLDDNDILFIDSTHTVKAGSDCLWIYLKLLPAILRSEKKVLVHSHDIFLPSAIPKSFLVEHRLAWTEQYLLYAFLLFNAKTKVTFSSNYSALKLKDDLEKLHASHPEIIRGGGSLWFEVNL